MAHFALRRRPPYLLRLDHVALAEAHAAVCLDLLVLGAARHERQICSRRRRRSTTIRIDLLVGARSMMAHLVTAASLEGVPQYHLDFHAGVHLNLRVGAAQYLRLNLPVGAAQHDGWAAAVL